METNKWLFFGVLVALIVVVLGVTELQRYRLAQPAHQEVDPEMGQPVAVFYPSTRWSGGQKLDPAPLLCKVIECREPATIIDEQGRVATIAVRGQRSARPIAMSPNGKQVGIVDDAYAYRFADGAFTTFEAPEIGRSGEVVIDDGGTLRSIEAIVESTQTSLPPIGNRVLTFTDKATETILPRGDGRLYSCDGNHMILQGPPYGDPTFPYKEFHLNPETNEFEAAGEVGPLGEGSIADAVCVGDGTGRMIVIVEGPLIEDQNLKSIQLFDKPWGGQLTSIAEKTLVDADFTHRVAHYGIVSDDEAVWFLTPKGEMRRIDRKTGAATTPWSVGDPFDPEAYQINMIQGDSVVIVGLQPGTSNYIARIYDRKTGEHTGSKQLPSLSEVYRGGEIQHIAVAKHEPFLRWLEAQPDLTE